VRRPARIDPVFFRVFFAACLLGGGVGLVASMFRKTVEWVQETLRLHVHSGDSPASLLYSIAIPALFVAITLWMVRRFAPEAGGSGIQEIEGALEGIRPVRWRRVLPVSGMVAGREGPTVQMGAQCGGMVRWLLRLPEEYGHALLAAGSAAGLSAAFNAPLSGVLFVIEEMRHRFRYGFLSVQAVLIASACADVSSRLVTNQKPVFEFAQFPPPAASTLWIFPLFGAFMGLIGVAFNSSLMSTLRGLDRLGGNRRLLAGIAIGGLVGVGTWAWRDATGGGYSAITDAVALRFATRSLLALFAIRFLATVLSYGSGVPGGIFTPMLALGTLLGVSLGIAVHTMAPGEGLHPAVFAVVGMGALFSSTVRAPLTGIALSIELTASFDLILPLLLACSISTLVAEALGGQPIYELLLARTLDLEDAAKAGPEPPA